MKSYRKKPEIVKATVWFEGDEVEGFVIGEKTTLVGDVKFFSVRRVEATRGIASIRSGDYLVIWPNDKWIVFSQRTFERQYKLLGEEDD